MKYPVSWAKWAFTSLQLVLSPETYTGSTDATITTGPAVSKLPVLGWSSWHVCTNGSSHQCVIDMAEALNSSGLFALGYKYMALDDGWQARPARVNGTLQANSDRYPGGMIALSTDLHAKGFKLGIYSDAGAITCGGNDGSFGFEAVDAQSFAAWGVDYLKYDNCCIPKGHWDTDKYCPAITPKLKTNTHCQATPLPTKCASPTYNWKDSNTFQRYNAMGQALQTHGPNILLSMSIWGTADVTTWGPTVGTSWRIWRDMVSKWPRFLEIVRGASQFLHTTTFNAHNDADLLQLGNGDFKDILKARSHFALWAAMKSPLILATDIAKLVSEHLDIVDVVKNPYLNAFNQDEEHGGPALPFNWPDRTKIPQYWAGALTFNGTSGTLVLTLNVAKDTEVMRFSLAQIGLNGGRYQIVDAWNGEVVAACPAPETYEVPVRGNDTAVYFVAPC